MRLKAIALEVSQAKAFDCSLQSGSPWLLTRGACLSWLWPLESSSGLALLLVIATEHYSTTDLSDSQAIATDLTPVFLQIRCFNGHLSISQRAAIAVEIQPMFEEIAKQKQREQGPRGTEGGRGNQKTLGANPRQGFERAPRSADQAGRALGVSGRTVAAQRRVAYLSGSGGLSPSSTNFALTSSNSSPQ